MEFRTIETYDNAADVIREHCPSDVSDEILDYLRHIVDFESVGFLVVNSDFVIAFDTISGYVYSRKPIEGFILDSIEEAMEEISDEI